MVLAIWVCCTNCTVGGSLTVFLPKNQFDDEALEPVLSRYNHADEPDRPPRGRDRAATYAEHQPHDLAIEAKR